MSYPATDGERRMQDDARRQNAVSLLFFLLITFAVLLRVTISPQLMNMVVDYTAETGAIYEKLHFGTYALFLLTPILLFSRPIYLQGEEIVKFKALLRYTLLMSLLVVILIGTGRAGSSGFYIDSYVTAGAAGLLMFSINVDLRRLVGGAVLGMLVLSAIIGIGEAVTETRLLPYGLEELSFRPTGLSDHPLTLGLLCATGIGFAALLRLPIWARVAIIFVLFIGCAASGGRFALLLAAAEIFILLIYTPWTKLSAEHERQAKFVVLVFAMVAGAALVALLLAGGLLSRFGDTLFDENFMARITVYQVFSYTSISDILFGTDLGYVLRIVNERLNLPYIESTPVVVIYQIGLILALFFTWLVVWIVRKLLDGAPRPAWIATWIFFIGALSNNTLSSKTATITIIMVLLCAFATATPSPAAERARP